MKIKINDVDYIVLHDYKNAFDKEELENKFTDYFEPYDYIVGDYSYGKLRLKGFCNQNNKIFNKINDYNKLEEYLKNNCAYDCKYFVVKKDNEGK